jgi:hypothetical protein
MVYEGGLSYNAYSPTAESGFELEDYISMYWFSIVIINKKFYFTSSFFNSTYFIKLDLKLTLNPQT